MCLLIAFVLCAVMRDPIDAVTYVIAFLFAMSNGYASTICMMLGPSEIPASAKELAGNIMV